MSKEFVVSKIAMKLFGQMLMIMANPTSHFVPTMKTLIEI